MRTFDATNLSITPPPSLGAHLPPIGASIPFSVLSEFRGRVLYDGGRRPSFRAADGRHHDEEALDRHAFQVAIHEAGSIAGCVRANPIYDDPPSAVTSLLGRAELERVLGGLGARREGCWEASRWVADPDRRRGGLGARLIHVILAIARHLGGTHLFGAAGTRQGQALHLVQIGASCVTACPKVTSRELDDEIQLICFDLHALPARTEARVEEQQRLLSAAWSDGGARGRGRQCITSEGAL